MAGFALSGAAAGAAGALEDLLKQEFLKQIQRASLAERVRENDMQNAVANRGLTLGERKLGEDSRQFDVSAGQTDRRLKVDEAYNPVRIANTQAETGEILRKPKAEQENRDFVTGRDKTQHGYEMQQIGAHGANALRVANVRHPDASGAAAAQKDADEAQDVLDLLDALEKDPALAASVGVLDGRGAGMLRDPEGYARFKGLHDQLVGKLQLANSGKLKGQGAVSNAERDLLRQASTALARTLGEKDYKGEIGKIRGSLQRTRGAAAPRGNLQTGGPVNLNSAAQEFDWVPGKGLVPRGKK